jgi:8-oxo-dGTP diphosphatase
MDRAREILKIGLAVIEGDRLLLVKKRNSDFYILPGGKPEQGENDIETLSREIDEELGCGIAAERLRFLGTFSDEVAGVPNARVTIRLYAGALVGTPSPRSEIDSLRWWKRTEYKEQTLAPSLRNSILPFLCDAKLPHVMAQESQKVVSDR